MAKSVFVAHAATKIGRACVTQLNSQFQVFAGVDKEEDAKALRKISQTIIPLQLEVYTQEQIKGAFVQIREVVGKKGLDALVNQTPLAFAAPLENLPLEEMKRHLEVNVMAPLALCQEALPLLRVSKGRIVNIGSVLGKQASPLLGAQSITAHALEGLNDSLRLELQAFGIHVAMIEAGLVQQPLLMKMSQIEKTTQSSTKKPKIYGTMMHQRSEFWRSRQLVSPEAVAAQVVHALTARRPRSRYVTGTQARLQMLMARWLPDGLRDRMALSR